jgi:hypothetical protein
MAQDTLSTAEDTLARALEEAENDRARYHIREAAQRIVVAEWEHDSTDR